MPTNTAPPHTRINPFDALTVANATLAITALINLIPQLARGYLPPGGIFGVFLFCVFPIVVAVATEIGNSQIGHFTLEESTSMYALSLGCHISPTLILGVATFMEIAPS